MFSNLPGILKRLDSSLQTSGVSMENIPRELMDQYVAVDGRYLIQISPREDGLLDAANG
jgi:hypothetical protein